MKLTSLGMIALILAALAITGCRTAPIYNVRDAPIASETTPTMDDIAKAIKRAGNSLGWQIKEDKPGHMTGTLYLRRHTAIVDISYDRKKYSITYKDSKELNYDGEVIHPNYNGWIQNLDNAIRGQVNNI